MYIIINILSLLSTLLLTSRFQVLPMLQKRALYKGVNNRGKNCGNQFSVCQQWQHVCSPSWGMVTWRVRESGICSGGSYSHGSSESRGCLPEAVCRIRYWQVWEVRCWDLCLSAGPVILWALYPDSGCHLGCKTSLVSAHFIHLLIWTPWWLCELPKYFPINSFYALIN